MKLELRHLRAVVAVAEHRHFSEAARTLHTSQPNLSRLIRHIEAELETRLFDRHTRGVVLTPFGREFVRHASSVLDLHRSGMSDLNDLLAMRRGHVTVAALPSISTSMLAEALLVFRAAHPAIDITIRDDVAASIVELVREARVDFGIGLAASDMTELESFPVAVDTLMLVCRNEHALAAKLACDWQELAGEAVIAFSHGSSVRALMERAFAENGMAVRPAMEVSHLSSAEGLALQGFGAAILPSTRTLAISDPRLRAIPLRNPEVERELVLLQRRGRALSRAAEALKQILTGSAEQSGTPRPATQTMNFAAAASASPIRSGWGR